MAEFAPPGTKYNPAKLGPFPEGMNNKQPRHAVPDGFAANIVNADVTDSGILRRRAGYARKIVGTNITAAWESGDTVYYVDSGNLYRAKPDINGNLSAAVVPNSAGALLSRGAVFVDVAGQPVLGDTFGLFSISDSGLERFTHNAPGIASVSAAAGNKAFLVAVTGALPNSETQPSRIERVVGDFPLTVNLAAGYGYPVNVYVSKPDGAMLYWRAKTSSTPVVLNSSDIEKRQLMTGHMMPTPSGSIMRYAFGRLFSVVGPTVFYSLPYYPSVCSAVGGFIPFAHNVTVFETLDAGFVVGTDREIGLITGKSPDVWEYRTLVNYGAVRGTSLVYRDGTVFVMTEQGQASVSRAGEFTNLHEGKVIVGLATAGASGAIKDDGLDRVVTALTNSESSRAEASTFMEFEVIRKEVVL